jgi:murein DD-endopeptidase MepM/ murein hydrolase activator NlpD
MKSLRCLRALLAGSLILTLVAGAGGAQAYPGGPGGDGAPPAGLSDPRNVAFGKTVFFSTNGVDAPLPSDALGVPTLRMNAPAVTDGNLDLTSPPASLGQAGAPGGMVFYNPTWGRTLAITITIDLQGTYKITRIRYNPGNGLAAMALPDTVITPLGSSPPARAADAPPAPDGATLGPWTTQTGQTTADTITVVLHKTRGLVDTGLLGVGEIEVYGVPAPATETLKFPFDPGHEWRITQGYHGDTSHNKWERAYVCGQDYLAFDMARVDFNTDADHVRAPAGGRVWVIWPALGAVMLRHDWPDGVYFTSIYHMNPINPDLRLGEWVPQGAVLGVPGAQGLEPGAGVHIHWSFYKAANSNLIPPPDPEARTPNWCRDSVHWVDSAPFLHVEAAGRGLLDFTDDPTFSEPCGCEGMYAEKHYFSTQYEIGTVPAAADVPGLADDTPTDQGGVRTFPETAHTLGPPFRAFWDAHGGQDLLGAPVTEAYWTRDRTGTHEVQVFERADVNYYPAAVGTPAAWSLDRLGAQLYGGQHRTDGWQPVSAFATTDRQRYFPETQHGTYGAFYRQWQAAGGLAGWGYPISEPFYEADPLTGVTYLTQYFERARLEYHPESQGTPAEIHANRLGLLGLIGKGWVAP